jgi:hypothetical protein
MTLAKASTVLVSVKELFLTSGSGVVEVTVTRFLNVPEASGSTIPVILIVSLSPALIVSKVQRLVVPLSGEGVEDENRKLAS